MKKWWKIILGILLIGAAAGAMYYWNAAGRRQLEEAKAEAAEIVAAEIVKDPEAEMYEKGMSYFPIPVDWIAVKSVKLASGDWVGIYYKTMAADEDAEVEAVDELISYMPFEDSYEKYELERIGAYEVAYTDEKIVEIICSVDDFKDLENKLAGDNSKLFMVMEAKNE